VNVSDVGNDTLAVTKISNSRKRARISAHT